MKSSLFGSAVSGSKLSVCLLLAAAGAALALTPSAASGQDLNEIYKRYLELDAKLDDALPDYKKLRDKAERKKVKEKGLVAVKEMQAHLAQMAQHVEIGGLSTLRGVEIKALLHILGEEEIEKKLKEDLTWSLEKLVGSNIELPPDAVIDEKTADAARKAKTFAGEEIQYLPSDVSEALDARCLRIAIDYFEASTDSDKTKAIDQFEMIAKKFNRAYAPAGLASFMLSVTESIPLEDRILDIVRLRLSSSSGGRVAVQYEAPRKLRNAIGKPLNFRYKTMDGKPLQPADYKGKVLILHFFATTNEKSVKDVNKMNRLFLVNNKKGVELVSVSCDASRADLTLWLKEYRRATWPILLDDFMVSMGRGGWHPLTLEVGIAKLPATLLIDRKGILRYANPEDVDAKLKELIEEK